MLPSRLLASLLVTADLATAQEHFETGKDFLTSAWRRLDAEKSGISAVAWGDQGFCAQQFGEDDLGLPRDTDPEAWVEAHNHYRACHGVPPITWDPELVPLAKRWAEALVLHCEGEADVAAWASAAGPEEHRPHDPDTYTTERPRNGENIFVSDFPTASPATAVESWYREVETECSNQGRAPGCGGGRLNHFTAMVWKEASRLGCYSAVRGSYKVVSCRYAAADEGSDCRVPNTQGCDAEEKGPAEVPALVDGPCAEFVPPKEDSAETATAGVQNANFNTDCVAPYSLGMCDPCLSSDQCGDNRYCCPFMKKCVADGSEKCYAPIAFCIPPCDESQDPTTCTCKSADFPSKWQKPLCKADASRLYNELPIIPSRAGSAAALLTAGLVSTVIMSVAAVAWLRRTQRVYSSLLETNDEDDDGSCSEGQ